MKKFELGKVYQHLSRNDTVLAEFSPLYIGEVKAFGIWKSLLKVGDECETNVSHSYLCESAMTRYREKPPEPESIELFVNIYKDKNGKLSSGGVHYCQSKADVANHWENRSRIGIAYIKFTEGDG